MIRKLLLLCLSVAISLPILRAQNFEGIIIYERTTSDGKLALITYYFGDQKIRKDSRFIFSDYFRDYVTIMDFKNYTNKYFSDSGDNMPFRPMEITKNSIARMDVLPDVMKPFLGYECYRIDIEFEIGPFSSLLTQTRFHAKDLKFSVPEEWMLDYSMIISGDDNICLYSTTYLDTVDPDLRRLVGDGGSFTFRAIKVIPKKLPDALFDYDTLLAESKYNNQERAIE